MAKKPDLNHLEMLYAALHSPLGVYVATSDPERLRQKLYPLRKSDPDLMSLSFVISPINGKDLWIIKTKGQDDAESI